MENNEFDPNILQEFFDKRDYDGAANYLESIPAIPSKQYEVNAKIRELRRNAAIQNSFLENADSDVQQAYHFASGLQGKGSLPNREENEYSAKYLDYINNLRCNDNTYNDGTRISNNGKINKIAININSKELFNNYLDKLGMSEYELNDLEGVYTINDPKDGHINVLINTNNKQLISLLENAYDLNTSYRQNIGGRYFTKIVKNFSIYGVTDDNKMITTDDFNYDNVRKAMNLADDAIEKQNKLLSDKEVQYDEEIYITPFLGLGHERAYNRMKKGLITSEQYKKIVEERTDTYNRLLAGAGLSQYEVYMATGEEGEALRLEKIENNKGQRDKITEYILSAMKDKRIEYQAASVGGNIGTYITIYPATNEKKEKVSGEYGQFRRIFVPGLFKSSCDQTFNNDTKTMSIRDNSDMKHWKYGKTLNDGSYVGYDSKGAYMTTTDYYGNPSRSYMSEQEMLQLLNKDNIINKSVETLLSNIDDNGNPKTKTINGKKVTFDIRDMINTLSIAGVNEIYPDGTYSDEERLRYQNEMSNIITKILRNTFYKQHNIKQ